MSEKRNERALTTMAELARASQRDFAALGLRHPSRAPGLDVSTFAVWSLVLLAACGSGGGGASGALGPATTQPELIAVQFGRLVDVYGLRTTPNGTLTELYARDVVIGGNIADQRPANSSLTDAEITYDFTGADPDSLQQRLLNGLKDIEQVFINGSLDHRVPQNLNISFNFVEGESLIMGIKGLAVSSGSACTSASLEPSYVLRALGRSDELAHSSLRMTIGRFTTEEEIDYAISTIRENVTRLRELSPLWEMFKDGVDLSTIQWAAH